MKKKRNLQRIRKIGWLFYVVLVLYAIRYQVTWQTEWEGKLLVRSAMAEFCETDRIRDLLQEAKCFPVKEASDASVGWSFEDGYGGERTYGGHRKHEGIDIMASKDQPGCLQVCAVTDGVIEQMGWLNLGGYRIGIRSPSGNYYYYAHLAEYATKLQVGDRIKAGEVLGTMGNSGYGKEGTTGMFPVHLHFGIYMPEKGKDQSVNPYSLLYYLEQRRKYNKVRLE